MVTETGEQQQTADLLKSKVNQSKILLSRRGSFYNSFSSSSAQVKGTSRVSRVIIGRGFRVL